MKIRNNLFCSIFQHVFPTSKKNRHQRRTTARRCYRFISYRELRFVNIWFPFTESPFLASFSFLSVDSLAMSQGSHLWRHLYSVMFPRCRFTLQAECFRTHFQHPVVYKIIKTIPLEIKHFIIIEILEMFHFYRNNFVCTVFVK